MLNSFGFRPRDRACDGRRCLSLVSVSAGSIRSAEIEPGKKRLFRDLLIRPRLMSQLHVSIHPLGFTAHLF